MKGKKSSTKACRICGCTENDCSGCIARDGHPCSWVETDLCSSCSERSPEYLAGFDCGINGANTTNSNFMHFLSPAKTKDWEAGKADAEKSNKKQMANFKLLFAALCQIKGITLLSGTIECPKCKGVLHFSKAKSNGHTRGKCESENCLSWME